MLDKIEKAKEDFSFFYEGNYIAKAVGYRILANKINEIFNKDWGEKILLNKKEIDKAKEITKKYIEDTPVAPYECLMNEERNSAIILMNYIEQLESKVKKLGKGQHTLMQSRRKWKSRYYKERRKCRYLKRSNKVEE